MRASGCLLVPSGQLVRQQRLAQLFLERLPALAQQRRRPTSSSRVSTTISSQAALATVLNGERARVPR
ncbi:hypothetical protein [Streptomyces sp. C10]|uniref:hypothetical protein n=1 Tax=Streptomyces sp. C10 TaxID=531941 RepID=UPI0039806F16